MSERMRVRIIVSGRVQGVFFRDSTRRRAEELGVAGLVRNRRDGTVEIVAEGPRENVDRLISWARVGPPHAAVTDVAVSEEAPEPGMSNFRIEPTL